MIKIENEIILRPTYWASVSGGKDSLFMLNYILHNLDRYPLHGVVHFELEIDYPFIKDVIDYMEEQCTKAGITFYRIKPRKSFKELYEKWGFPTRFARWCNGQYKMDAKKQLTEFLNQNSCRPIFYIGYCYDEVKRYQKRKVGTEIYPLVEAKIEEDAIWEWAKTQPIFNDYYKFNRRCGCMFCPMQTMMVSAYLLKYYPKEYENMMAMAKAKEQSRSKKTGKPYSVWKDNPKYNTEYRDKRVREVYLPKLEEMAKQIAG